MRRRKLGSKLLTGMLGVLGFVGCDGLGEEPDMYGCPIVNFLVKGVVTSENGDPLKGVQVVVGSGWDNDAYGADTIYTDAKGEFESHELADITINMQRKVYFNDIDEQENGGTFKSDSITLEKMKKKQLEKGNSWYEGKFEFSTNEPVKLSKAEKKPEE